MDAAEVAVDIGEQGRNQEFLVKGKISMKIAVPVNVKSMDSRYVYPSDALPISIFDTDTKEAVFLDNATAAGTGAPESKPRRDSR